MIKKMKLLNSRRPTFGVSGGLMGIFPNFKGASFESRVKEICRDDSQLFCNPQLA
jgi:hypothetical protein